MATISKSLLALGLLCTAFTSSASADTYHHIDELALSIERNARALLSETHHYRHTSEYRHLVSDTRNLVRLADHLHDVAHRHGSLAHMESDLRHLDREFHHLEGVFDRVERRSDCRYGGHIHGSTLHVKRLLNAIENDIHHLSDDIASLRRPVHSHRPVVVTPTPYVRPTFPRTSHSSGYGYHTSGHTSPFGHGYAPYGRSTRTRSFSIGGGSTRITFGF